MLSRKQCPSGGRNHLATNSILPGSATYRHHKTKIKAEKNNCSYPECKSTNIESRFAVNCGKCGNWFHGECVSFPKEMVKLVDQESKMWICDPCTKKSTIPLQQPRNSKQIQSSPFSEKISPKLQERKQQIVSSASSNWTKSDNDSGLDNLAESRHNKRQTLTNDQPKNFFCLGKIVEKYEEEQKEKQQIAMKRQTKTNEPTAGPSDQKNLKMSRNETEETEKKSLKYNKLRLHRK